MSLRASGLALLATALVCCTSVLQPLRDHTAPPGLLNEQGTINPCHGDEADPQACGNARFSARHVGLIRVGLGPDDVRAIMHNDPDAREVRDEGGTVIERWAYLTDYRRRLTTIVVFTDGRVTGFDAGTWTK
jgi:hypothetical protein